MVDRYGPMGQFKKFVVAAFLGFGLFLLSFMTSHIPYEVHEDNMTFGNISEEKYENEYEELEASETAYDTIKSISTIISAFLVFRVSAKMLFGTGITGSAFSTLLLPVALANGYIPTMFVNSMKGLFEGMIYPPMLILCGFWFPPAQITTLMSIVIFGLEFGKVSNVLFWNCLSMEDSWTQYYYIPGGLGVMWAGLYFWLMKEKPNYYSSVSAEVADGPNIDVFLTDGRISVRKLPWKKMLRSKSIISLISMLICNSLNLLILNCTILILHNEIDRETIVYTSLGSTAAASLIVIFSGMISDSLRSNCQFSTTFVRKLFGVGAQFGFGIVIAIIGFYCNNIAVHLAFFGVAIVLEIIIFLIAIVNVLDIAPRTSGLIFSLCIGLASFIAHAILQVVLMFIVLEHSSSPNPDDLFSSFENLERFFITCIVMNILGGIVFGLFASGEKQEFWDDQSLILIENIMPQQNYNEHQDANRNQNINDNEKFEI